MTTDQNNPFQMPLLQLGKLPGDPCLNMPEYKNCDNFNFTKEENRTAKTT